MSDKLYSLLELEEGKIYTTFPHGRHPNHLYKIEKKNLFWKDKDEKYHIWYHTPDDYPPNEKIFSEVIEKKTRKIQYWRHFYRDSSLVHIQVRDSIYSWEEAGSEVFVPGEYTHLKSFLLHEFEINEE